MRGGEVINSGGYSCTFRPSLNCKYNSNNNRDNENNDKYISKLLFNKSADQEILEINKIKPLLFKIPNNDKYFLMNDITYCKPDKLSKDDLQNIEKCSKLFKKNNFDKNKLNDELNKFTIINIPYGGIDLEAYIYSSNFKHHDFIKLNNNLIDLIQNAIIPINKINLIHMDLKDQNILIQNNNLKIIDWGLSFIKSNNNYEYNYENFKNNLYRRPLQYNLPYSILILNNSFWENFINYYNYYNSINKKIDDNLIKFILKQILYNLFYDQKYGHNMDLMNNIIPILFDNEDLSSQDLRFNKFINVMLNIYSSIFDKFFNINNKIFKVNEYIQNIYLNNCDIFGIITVYFSIYEKFYNEKNKNINLQLLKKFIIKYLFDTRFYVEKYNINELIADIKELNKIIKNVSNNKTRKKK